MQNVISGYELTLVNTALQNAQDAATFGVSGGLFSQHVVRASAQIGYTNDGQPVIEQQIDLSSSSGYFGPVGFNQQPKLNSETRLLGEAMRLAALIQQFVDDHNRIIWVTLQDDLNKGQVVTNFTATAYYDDNNCPKVVSQETKI